MADYRLCSIPGCGRTHKSHSYCNLHYLRLRRHGDPLKTIKTPNGEASSYYQEVVLQYDGYECLTWPYACNADGYGMVWRDGKLNNVHRLLCEAIHGPPPTPDHQAAHSCGNGGLGCSTKRHLSWKTRIQNKEDELAHGTRSRGERNGASKVTEAEVREIRALKGAQKDIAAKYGISKSAVSLIQKGKAWAWLKHDELSI